MSRKNRKYFYATGTSLNSSNKKSFLVFWKDSEKLSLSRNSKSSGPYIDFKDAEKIMIEHLINGTCSWIVSYNG